MSSRRLLHSAQRSQDAFVARAVRYLAAEVGLRQFLDLGSGIATGPVLHAVVQQITSIARVLYVTDDLMFLADADDAPSPTGSVDYRQGDLRDVGGVLEHAATSLNLDEPVAVILTGVLHQVADTDPVDPSDGHVVVAQLIDAMVAESHLVISHLACDIHPGEMGALARQLNDETDETWQFRGRGQVGRFFCGLDLVDPGLVQVDCWRRRANPRPSLERETVTSPMWVGVGRKP